MSFRLIFLFACIPYMWCDYELTVLHTNDVHAHVEEFNKYGGTCNSDNSKNCFGGVARRRTVIERIRKRDKNVILLDGGDQFQGTAWFQVYKGISAACFMNLTEYDAMAVGNHEFDNGPQGLVNFIQASNFSILTSNMDVSKEPIWPKDLSVKKSIILERNGQRIGVVGYTTAETSWLSNAGPNIKFHNVIDSVRQEAKRLKRNGLKIIIALGHAGIELDKKLAQEVNEVDIVVGGHSNTFLYNGPKPSNDKVEGPYPLSFTRADGTKALVVQDFTYGKYLGYLKVVFDDNGNVKSWQGNPILLNASYEQDVAVLKKIKELDAPILKLRKEPVGRTLVKLEGERRICRTQECNFGNLIADAIVKMTQQHPDETKWATVSLGMWNGGGIRSSIDKNMTETISAEELLKVLPFGNTADIVEIKGVDLLKAFEHSVSSLPKWEGRFLQVSGFRLKYNLGKKVGERLIEAKALCTKCRVPRYEIIKNEQVYKVVTSNYILGGGDQYTMLSKILKRHPGETAYSYLYQYVKQESPVAPAVEGRIVFVTSTGMVRTWNVICVTLSFAIFSTSV